MLKANEKGTSAFIGVSWDSKMLMYRARIVLPNGVLKHLGYKKYERDAALLYDKEAVRHGKPTNILKPLIKKAPL